MAKYPTSRASKQNPAPGQPQPVNAVQGILEAFKRFPVVALGEAHGWQEFHDFVQQLICQPEFALEVDCIVVEFGNARYQTLMDRFIAGRDPVSVFELRKVWRNTTQGAWYTWDNPVYEHFFRTVRAVNRSLPRGQRQIRILLGDPPIDWQVVQPSTFLPFLNGRDSHFAEVVERHVLEKNRKALLIAGFGHTLRTSAAFDGKELIDILDRKHPGGVFSVMPHAPFLPMMSQLESRLASWPTPSLALLGQDWLGGTSAEAILPGTGQKTLAQMANAYLYLGPGGEMTASQTDPAVFRDPEFARELARRRKLLEPIFNPKLKNSDLLEPPGIRYFPPKKP